MKLNFKTGGTGHILNDDPNWGGANGGTMIVGADVSHSGNGPDPHCPSLAGLVATFDQRAIHYAAEARLQANNTEVFLFHQFRGFSDV
jgi:eukaryotic translation initiation factor 2C